jgi:hypothetical protein
MVLIHAALVPDERPEAWSKVPPELREAAMMRGGIIGQGELTHCIEYCSPDAFTADRERHLNESTWFEPPKLFGFVFSSLKVLPYRRYPGWMRFFEVGEETEVDSTRAHRGVRRRGSANRD